MKYYPYLCFTNKYLEIMRYIALIIAIILIQAIIIYQFTKKDKYTTFEESYQISVVLTLFYCVIWLFIIFW